MGKVVYFLPVEHKTIEKHANCKRESARYRHRETRVCH